MWWKRLNLFLFTCLTYQHPCVDVQDFKRGTKQRGFAKGCLIISMTFMNFPKPEVIFQDFSRPGKRKWNSMTFPGFPWLDTPCILHFTNCIFWRKNYYLIANTMKYAFIYLNLSIIQTMSIPHSSEYQGTTVHKTYL